MSAASAAVIVLGKPIVVLVQIVKNVHNNESEFKTDCCE
jgi:hypothetical protein